MGKQGRSNPEQREKPKWHPKWHELWRPIYCRTHMNALAEAFVSGREGMSRILLLLWLCSPHNPPSSSTCRGGDRKRGKGGERGRERRQMSFSCSWNRWKSNPNWKKELLWFYLYNDKQLLKDDGLKPTAQKLLRFRFWSSKINDKFINRWILHHRWTVYDF